MGRKHKLKSNAGREEALKLNAAKVGLAHTHPSGSAEPSKAAVARHQSDVMR
jgi:DNA repair protein RadC